MDKNTTVILPDPPRYTNSEIPTNEYMNLSVPKAKNIETGLEPYVGTWDFNQASHLLRRATFGNQRGHIDQALALGLSSTVDLLLDSSEDMPPPPVNIFDDPEDDVPLGETFAFSSYNPNFDGRRRSVIKAWWTGLMLNQSLNLREKMTLFWHNHFVTEMMIVNDSRYTYKYQNILREHALGNFKSLVQIMTTDPAMLVYLNGRDNVASAPNENYARELFELFTIGKGATLAPGNYTNYTEQDVVAAARVLTGWRDNRQTISSVFISENHDTGSKEFSESFNSTVISNDDSNEYLALIDMIFEQPETARFICRKLYRWFIYYVIDDTIEANVIEPLAQIMIANNYEVKPVLAALFNSAHFHDTLIRGALIKNPIDFTVGLLRQFEVEFPAGDDFVAQHIMWYIYVYFESALQQMDLGDPPNVAGWAAYYQQPQFNQIWINSVTVPNRARYTDNVSFFGFPYEGFFSYLNPIPMAEATSNSLDPNVLIHEVASLLMPLELTEVQLAFLKEALIPGLPDFEWTVEWGDYLNDPTDPCKINAVGTKLRALIHAMFSMAEYHLS